MYFEMLSNKEEKIFLQAIDQSFSKSENDDSKFDDEELVDFDEFLGNPVHKLNVKFCENLDVLELSTEVESEDSISSPTTKSMKDSTTTNEAGYQSFLSLDNFISSDKESINAAKNIVLKKYYEHQELISKIKEIFKSPQNEKEKGKGKNMELKKF